LVHGASEGSDIALGEIPDEAAQRGSPIMSYGKGVAHPSCGQLRLRHGR
jgi:hypothetical protein